MIFKKIFNGFLPAGHKKIRSIQIEDYVDHGTCPLDDFVETCYEGLVEDKTQYSKVHDDKEIKSLDFLFLQFMHIIRAQHEDFDTTTQSVLNFFTKQDKKVYYGASENWLYKDETMPFILNLADFWLNPQDYLSRKSTNCLKNLNLFQNDA